MRNNTIRTDLLAAYCGLDASSKHQWDEWILSLGINDILLVRGRITQGFGRPEFDIANNNPTNFLLRYLSELQQEFDHWATSSGDLVDYYFASMAANLSDTSTTWYWQPQHKSAWLASGRSAEVVPHGVRVTPLISDSLSNHLEHILDPYLGQFIERLAASVEQREYWIAHVESSAVDLFGSENAICNKVLEELKALRYGHRDNNPVNSLTISDISNVAHIADSHHVIGLIGYLNDLEEVVSDLRALGTIEFWNHTVSGQHERRIIESLLARHRNSGWFEVSGTRLIKDSEARQAMALLDVLRKKLTSQEFQQHSLSIDSVHDGLQSLGSISEWSRHVNNSLQKEIERTICESRKGESRYESVPEIDHWRAPKR